MGNPSDPCDPMLAWKSVLDSLEAKSRERLQDLLKTHLSRPRTAQQWIAKWEKVLSADYSRIPAEQHIATLEASLAEAITVLKERVREQSSSTSHRSA
ncbi:hypothetical protein [Acidithiobacillus ferridurans]|uniref:hypothetical protein n=1 Tax=Acidithiobacillus ferridurans TaxID=1232575 RepID=UPI001C06E6CC|nr:hypothetical protein [Acidithiobacillus ferridurans]MBU2733563.1 hypothetical protein [Acidithiobacillus ferridurans]